MRTQLSTISSMTIVLSHITALDYWRTSPLHPCSHKKIPHAKKLIRQKPAPTPPVSTVSSKLPHPLHVLVSDRQFRKQNQFFITHTWKEPLFKGSILGVEENIFVSSPELCFIQIASTLSLVKLIEVGYELCGYYNNTHKPLTSVDQIRHFVLKYRGATNVNKVMRALLYIIDNSASPMETKLAMLLSLPFKMGGYSFEKPLLNARIDKVARDGSTLGECFYADLLWPDDRIILEYDSDERHDNFRSRKSDVIRQRELSILGYNASSVVSSQIMTSMGIENIAFSLAKAMNRRMRLPEPGFSQARLDLRKELFNR